VQIFSKKCLVGDLVVFECFYFGVVGKVVVWRKFLVVSENFNLATLNPMLTLIYAIFQERENYF
jgi:hypothetical protein